MYIYIYIFIIYIKESMWKLFTAVKKGKTFCLADNKHIMQEPIAALTTNQYQNWLSAVAYKATLLLQGWLLSAPLNLLLKKLQLG